MSDTQKQLLRGFPYTAMHVTWGSNSFIRLFTSDATLCVCSVPTFQSKSSSMHNLAKTSTNDLTAPSTLPHFIVLILHVGFNLTY